jgi:hypothetical protein
MPRTTRVLSALALTTVTLALAACDTQDQDAVNRAAKGTKQAVDRTADAIKNAQQKTSDMADDISDKAKEIVKPK